MTTIASLFGQSPSPIHEDNANELIVGVECEIESVESYQKIPHEYFAATNDGSLRNNGLEFISVPLYLQDSVHAFTGLHATLKLSKRNEAFSPRTSIHVHANCRNLEESVVKTIILLYALYEEAFFLLVNPERRDNIHCVPLTETYLSGKYKTALPSLIETWHKYTALNIKPLSEHGTIEFRHMQGHDDPKLYEQWLGAINGLFEAAKRVGTINVGLIDNDKYLEGMFNDIFGKTHIAGHWTSVRAMMVNSILDVKLGL